MIGVGSRLPAACLEKLQEISGAAAFFVVTQTAANNIRTIRTSRNSIQMYKSRRATESSVLPSWTGGEKNSTSVARLLKKSFMKNNASFKQTRKYVGSVYSFDTVINTLVYLINIEAKRHKGDTQAALWGSLA